MLEATSYRYEVMQPKARTLANTGAQAVRIKQMQGRNDPWDSEQAENEMLEAMEKQLKWENKVNQRADWDEKLQLKTEFKRLKAGDSIIRGEMKLAGKCLVEVRRAALKKLLDEEMEQYKTELNSVGKTFHKQRI
ncbi:cilia- and flagella-associated protein 141-like isoform X1 [Watersipora subatra]|uniref:cilia- and flagella-associated protein 141-like isoform X1 n=1 Tax=Watersipora subatra TaxID=2589382 RepID=UPI00355C1B74